MRCRVVIAGTEIDEGNMKLLVVLLLLGILAPIASAQSRPRIVTLGRKYSRFPTACRPPIRLRVDGQDVRSACGSVTVPGFSSAARVVARRYAFGSTPQSFADSMRL